MANALSTHFAEAMLSGLLSGNNVKASLMDTGTYTFSASHEFYSDLTGVVADSANLASMTFTDGTFDAADVTFSSVSGSTAEAIWFWIDTGTPSTSRLIHYLDTGVTGLPVTPNGGDINLNFNASGILTISS